jgi:hypothetical protein
MVRCTGLIIIGTAAVLFCSGLGLSILSNLNGDQKNWITVKQCWLWPLGKPRPTNFALRTASIEQNIDFWGPLERSTSSNACTWGRSAPPRPIDADENGYRHFFMNLRNPEEFRSVAVIEVKANRVVELNPRRMLHPGKPWQTTYDYGPIPPLCDLTSAESEQLWTCSKYSSPGMRTYKLKAFNDTEDADYFIDIVFENGHLQKYRVRSSATKGMLVLKPI